ncbi:MAG TPA: winged helix-turn-helix domain-containing protein [Bryobacteraceae bacterium]|nr:winged helix-turn-helix domain-containing protein [Bryobacteraceae bacterium]
MQPVAPAGPAVFRFGIFEFDEAASELRRSGRLVHLAPQPLQILGFLLRNAGEVVDRNRIRQEIWGDTTVDFDRSLNVAVAQIRSVLNDNSENPLFIQTLPKKGYRFVAEVARVCEAPPPAATPKWTLPRKVLPVSLGILLLALLAGGLAWRHRIDGPIRIAVLPFENVSLRDSQFAASDGLFDDLLTRLSGIQPDRIRVIGRRSISYLAAKSPSIRDISKQLDVRYLVESTARPDSSGLRLAVRLVETENQTVLWSATFTQDSSPEAFQETVVAGVSAGVLTTIFPGTSPRSMEATCQDGWEDYQTARLLTNRGGLKNLERSLPFFQKSACPAAMASFAETLVRLARSGQAINWEEARTAAQDAAQRNSSLSAADLALGNISFWHDWNWQAARRELNAALRINPSDPDGHHDLAWLQVASGSLADALASIHTAIALDPFSTRTRIDSAWLLLQIGRFNEAATEARRTLELDPDLKEARACLSRALLYAGDAPASIEAIKPLLSPAIVAELEGLPAPRAVRRLMEFEIQKAAGTDPYERAWRLAWLGSRAEALTALEQAFQAHSMMMPLTAVDPAFSSLRNEPRFRKIVADLGLR